MMRYDVYVYTGKSFEEREHLISFADVSQEEMETVARLVARESDLSIMLEPLIPLGE